jgi:GntR family transcriptional repressor for pyruvate dehydrogenase complex
MSGTQEKSFLPVQKRLALVDQALKQLRARILEKEFGAGGELPPEGGLAQMLGVSRTVIREAMRMLQAEGLVEVAQGRRARVKPATAQFAVETMVSLVKRSDGTLLDLIEVRIPLERAIAGLAAERATVEQMEMMEDAIHSQVTAPKLSEQIDADLRFHSLLAASTGNAVFEMFLGTLAELLRESFSRTNFKTGAERAVCGHRGVLEAIRQRDVAAAQREMTSHLELAKVDLLAWSS